MRLNKYEIGIIGFIILIFFGIGYRVQPFAPMKAKVELEAKISDAEDYYEEAKALSLSMPLLNDSAVSSIGDSLMITLIDLNRSWVIFVKTQKDFKHYTNDIQTMNTNLESLRVKYEFERGMRHIMRGLQNITPRIEKREKKPKGQQV